MAERRVTMQRRMFDIPLAGLSQWSPGKPGDRSEV